MHFFKSRFKKALDSTSSLEEAARLLYDFRFLGLTTQPYQQREEILGFMKLVESAEPKAVLEIGTGYGGTLILFTRAASHDAKIIGLDLPPSTLTIGSPRWRESLLADVAEDCQSVSVLRGNSHDDSTFRYVRQHLGDCRLDVLFIDGDHSYEGVKRDFEMYSPLVRKEGIIGFHDIVPNLANPDIGVPRFWNELKHLHRHEEFSVETHRNGIGVVYLD